MTADTHQVAVVVMLPVEGTGRSSTKRKWWLARRLGEGGR